MLGYYVECDTAACGGISEGPTRPGPVRQKDKPAINGAVKRLRLKHNFTTRAVEHCEHQSNSAAQVVQQSTSLTYGQHVALRNSRLELHYMKSPTVKVQSLLNKTARWTQSRRVPGLSVLPGQTRQISSVLKCGWLIDLKLQL